MGDEGRGRERGRQESERERRAMKENKYGYHHCSLLYLFLVFLVAPQPFTWTSVNLVELSETSSVDDTVCAITMSMDCSMKVQVNSV